MNHENFMMSNCPELLKTSNSRGGGNAFIIQSNVLNGHSYLDIMYFILNWLN